MKRNRLELIDQQLESLNDLSQAVNYNQWIFDLIKPYLGARVLDVGCGTGNFIRYLNGRHVLGLDVHPTYLKIARYKFRHDRKVRFAQVDLNKSFSRFKAFQPDTIICINVLEHVKDDEHLIRECLSILPLHGKLIFFTPAIPWIFGEMDRTYGHFRRYTKADLAEKMMRNGMALDRCEYMNISGIFGWWLNGLVLKRKRIPRSQMLFYDKIFNYVVTFEKFLPKLIGLSIFTVGHRAKTGKVHSE